MIETPLPNASAKRRRRSNQGIGGLKFPLIDNFIYLVDPLRQANFFILEFPRHGE